MSFARLSRALPRLSQPARAGPSSSLAAQLRTLKTNAISAQLVGDKPTSKDDKFTIKLDAEYFDTHRCEAPELEMEVTGKQLIETYQRK